jgi:GTP-binding protein
VAKTSIISQNSRVTFTPAVEAKFLVGAVSPHQFPEPLAHEIAFLGRSNCGKSSLLNRFLGRKALARVSNTPGRTREINFFKVTFVKGAPSFLVADLPGYGYAEAPQKRVVSWGPLVESYLYQKRNQKAFLLMDIRRNLQEDEFLILDLLKSLKIPLTFIATKVDKFKRFQANVRAKAISSQIPPELRLILFSSLSGVGREEFILEALPKDYREKAETVILKSFP